MKIWHSDPYDITPSSVCDFVRNSVLGNLGMQTTETNQRNALINNVLKRYSNVYSTDYNVLNLKGTTFASLILLFMESREIMKKEDMTKKHFFELLSVLEKDAKERGLENFPLFKITSYSDFEKYSMEDFEELIKPLWELYPYRDEGFIRFKGLRDEVHSFCQWSMEWHINISSISCEITR